ncbi:hypothetical protein F4692_000887 [Nocardioides cavernae]|uniref:Glycosyltransferase family 2 protein n=1 Tax=Nocardioides cavernae TaxID=1921566 RepID=A0A7Y9H0Q0_9ACTN|nr:glycosyltransferase family 2 protein [Nocardioides cavernae]NYE35783.1 hypothetical protein [Nocardioides cavernae]
MVDLVGALRARVQLARALRSREVSLARRGFGDLDLPRSATVPGSVWAVMLVRDEEDIVGSTLDHLLAQGVAGIIVADHGSTDDTWRVLRQAATRDGRVHVLRDAEPGFYQGAKTSYLARRAFLAGADWVVPVDADEHWYAVDDDLATYFGAQTADVVWADMHEVFPATADGTARPDAAVQVETEHGAVAKVAFRARPWVWVGEGNHTIRGWSGDRVADLRILHYQYRSIAQFRAKNRRGVEGLSRTTGLSADVGSHWVEQAAMDEDQQQQRWSELVSGSREDFGERERRARVRVDAPGRWPTWDPSGELR